MSTQWHPLFAKLLRPLVESHFQVETNLAVGDAPRSADLVLLRRTATTPLPFQGLWRWLREWNVLEFKGPTVTARVADLDLLVELGLGIHRRLNEQRRKDRQPEVGRDGLSFWYLAPHLGRRFLADARRLLGTLEELGAGVWRGSNLERAVMLVSNRELPVERDSVPVHLLVKEPLETARQVAQVLQTNQDLWTVYGPWLATMNPALWEEVRQMGRKKSQGPVFDFEPVIAYWGLGQLIKQIGLERVIEEVGVKRVIEEVGAKRVVDELGVERVVAEVGLDALVAGLTPEQRQQLKRRL
jgi:hypothetical protein